MSVMFVALINRTLSILVLLEATVDTLKISSVRPSKNTISEPSVRVLIQVMLDKGNPSAVHCKERGAEFSWFTVLGATSTEGESINKYNALIPLYDEC